MEIFAITNNGVTCFYNKAGEHVTIHVIDYDNVELPESDLTETKDGIAYCYTQQSHKVSDETWNEMKSHFE